MGLIVFLIFYFCFYYFFSLFLLSSFLFVERNIWVSLDVIWYWIILSPWVLGFCLLCCMGCEVLVLQKGLGLNLHGWRPKSRTLDQQIIPDPMDPSSVKSLPKASFSTLRPDPTQRPTISSSGCITPNFQQNRNTTLPISRQVDLKPIDTPEHTTGHDTAFQRDKISSFHQNIGASPSPGNFHKALVQLYLWGGRFHS